MEDSVTGLKVDPALSFDDDNDGWVSVKFPLFGFEGPKSKTGSVPIKKIVTQGKEIFVTTVFDLMVANVGIDRGHGGDTTQNYDDPIPYTPAWQEPITGVPACDVIKVAREFAENAEKTQGKSMIFLGAGTNHWFHSDMIFARSSISRRYAVVRALMEVVGPLCRTGEGPSSCGLDHNRFWVRLVTAPTAA